MTSAPSERVAYRLAADTFDGEEIAAAKRVLDSGMLTMGNEVRAFEAEFASWLGAKHALMVNSGSSANLLAVDAMLRRSSGETPWKAGDEVLVPALAWPTTVWPLVQLGLSPVFVDVRPDTLAIDLESAKSALSPRTKGMFLIHVLGHAANGTEYASFCGEHGLVLLEDTCESLGAHHAGVHAGLFGRVSTFSCYFSHHISTIEGGLIVTDDLALRDDLSSLRAHGWVRDRSDKASWLERYPGLDERFMFAMAGYNVRPTEMHAAIGRVQLRKLDSMLAAREALAMKVHGWLASSAPWLELIGGEMLPEATGTQDRRARVHSWMTLPLRLRSNARHSVPRVKAQLESMGVDTRPIIAGNLAKHPAAASFRLRTAASLRQCDEIFERGFMIGCHPVASPGSLATLEHAIRSLGSLG